MHDALQTRRGAPLFFQGDSMRAASSIAIGLFAIGCGETVMGPDGTARVAHLSPDAPAVDFCIAAHGSDEWAGPVLGSAGGPLGLSFGQLTKYLDVEAMRYDVRLVAPAS